MSVLAIKCVLQLDIIILLLLHITYYSGMSVPEFWEEHISFLPDFTHG